jgi:hypothetical protein
MEVWVFCGRALEKGRISRLRRILPHAVHLQSVPPTFWLNGSLGKDGGLGVLWQSARKGANQSAAADPAARVRCHRVESMWPGHYSIGVCVSRESLPKKAFKPPPPMLLSRRCMGYVLIFSYPVKTRASTTERCSLRMVLAHPMGRSGETPAPPISPAFLRPPAPTLSP